MKNVCLWGPAEHATAEDEARLAARLEALGCRVERRARDAAPPADARAIVINTKRAIGPRELDAMPALELVVTTTSGYDHVDCAGCAARGVVVARCPLARRDAVVETTLAMGLALLRRLPELSRDAEAGRWVRAEVKRRRMPSIRGLTIGIVGMGVIGRRAHDAWPLLGANVIACDPRVPGLASLDELLAAADVLTLHCSLTRGDTGSDRMLDAARIAKLRPGAIVLNTARGECIDLPSLLAALDSGRIGGIGLDVFDPEPPIDLSSIARRANIVLTPHSAGYFDGLARAVEDEVVATLGAFVRGERLPEHSLPRGD